MDQPLCKLVSEKTHPIKFMTKTTVGTLIPLLAMATMASAEPIKDCYFPDQPSGVAPYRITNASGSKIEVKMRNFGIQDAEPARQYGKKLADMMMLSDTEAKASAMRQAAAIYPSNVFDQHCFTEQARLGYVNERASIKAQTARDSMEVTQ
jgi:hypothetical protein